MAIKQTDLPENLDKLNANLAKVEALSARLVAALGRKKQADPGLHGPNHDLFAKAASAYMAEMMSNPSKILEHQIGYWGKALKHYVEAQQNLAQGKLAPPEDHSPKDRRFSNELWETHPYFNYIKQQYLFSSRGDPAGGGGSRRTRSEGEEADRVFQPADHGHVQPVEFPRHQPRGAQARGRDRGPEPGGRAREPGARHRGRTTATCW